MQRMVAGLRFRLIFLILLAVIPALGLVYLTSQEYRGQVGREAGANLLRLARVASDQQEHRLDDARTLLGAVAQASSLELTDRPACDALLRGLLAQSMNSTRLLVADPSGLVLCSSDATLPATSVADREYFRQALATRAFALGEYVIDPGTMRAEQLVAYPILGDEEEPLGVLAAGIDLTWLSEFAATASLPPGSRLALHDHAGTVLVRYPNPEQWVGKATPGGLVSQGLKSGAREGTGESTGAEGVPRIFAFTPMGAPGQADEAYLSLAVSSSVAYAAADDQLRRTMLGLGAVALAALLAAWIGGEVFLLRRVRALVGAAERLAQGDLASRSGLAPDRSELGQLARAFDNMAQALEERSNERADLMLAIDRERATLDGVMAGMNQGVLVLDPIRIIHYCNSQAGSLLGIGAPVLTGDAIAAVIGQVPLASEARAELWQQLEWAFDHVDDYPTVPISLTLPRRRDLLLELFPLARMSGVIRGTCLLIRDVTSEREVERTKDELVSVVSHELRTPLAAVLGFADLMLERDLTEDKRREYLGIMVQEGRRLTGLVNDFLDLQRIEAGPQSGGHGSVDLRGLLEHAVALAEPSRTHPIELSIPVDLPPIAAHHDGLLQVLTNLLSNAKKYSPDGGRIQVQARLLDTAMEISVRDEGLGIPAEALPRVFEKFFRVDNSDRRSIKGTGLGLAICQKIVEAHGGQIHVASAGLGQGSRFSFTLPFGSPAVIGSERLPAPEALAATG